MWAVRAKNQSSGLFSLWEYQHNQRVRWPNHAPDREAAKKLGRSGTHRDDAAHHLSKLHIRHKWHIGPLPGAVCHLPLSRARLPMPSDGHRVRQYVLCAHLCFIQSSLSPRAANQQLGSPFPRGRDSTALNHPSHIIPPPTGCHFSGKPGGWMRLSCLHAITTHVIFSFEAITSSWISKCSQSFNEIPRLGSLEPSWLSWQRHTNST